MIIRYTFSPNPPQQVEVPGDVIVFGRDDVSGESVNIDLAPDWTVSRVHARIVFEDGAYWVEDLNSTNGTLIDGLEITDKTLLPLGTQAQMGQTLIEVLAAIDDETPAPQIADMGDGDAPLPGEVHAASPSPSVTAMAPTTTEPWYQLKAFYNLSRNLGQAKTLEEALRIVIEYLQRAFPVAQRGAVLLADADNTLLLKAHWPLGSHSVSMTLVNQAFAHREGLLWSSDPEIRIGLLESPSMRLAQVQAALYAPLVAGERILGVIYVDSYEAPDAFVAQDLELLKTIGVQLAMVLERFGPHGDSEQEILLRTSLLRQFSPQTVERMVNEYQRLRMGGERVNPVTILISDVRNFTSISAAMPPASVVRMLNEMFDAFVPIVFEHDGIVDKYVGDALLAIFGRPVEDPEQWQKAVRAALEMQQAMQKLGEGWKVRRLPVFEVGIGIHSGEVIHGFIGSAGRMEYTVIGNTVNQAARYCDGAKRGEIVISSAVYEHVYRVVDVEAREIPPKHPGEPDLKGYGVKGLRTVQSAELS
ncbi:MAG: GAF domain-containing protein [Anaerolineae bacterium]|nr:GAF domain-containing protein [Anaerolineae bacterium]